jgi:hypothetical protein
MGPTVWELEGPMPILKSSKRLVFIDALRDLHCRLRCGWLGRSTIPAMAKTPRFETVRDPALSLWQSVIHSKLLRHAEAGKTRVAEGHRGLGKTAEHPMMSSTMHAIKGMQHAVEPGPATMHGPPHPDELMTCAILGAKLAWATVFDRDEVPKLKDEFKNSTCDAMWMECYYEYEKLVLTGGTQPYLDYETMDDFVVEGKLPDEATIAVIGDWGTGQNDALVLLQQIAKNFKPDVLIHLGDIYYAGLPSEDRKHFTDLLEEVWPKKRPLIYVLDGNHDRYAGSNGGYYPMIAKLNKDKKFMQPNSYFCLRNNFWQFVAMETGYHDTNPWTERTNITRLEDSEAAWHRDKIERNGDGVDRGKNKSGKRGTVLFSHHQLMSRIGVGRDRNDEMLAVNPRLANAFVTAFDKIDFWMWGHEHDLCIYEPYTMDGGVQVPACRCVGASAIPVFVPEPEKKAEVKLKLPDSETKPPQLVPGTELGDNGEILNHAYAVMTLKKAALTIDYYQVDSTGASPGEVPKVRKIPYSDKVPGPKVAGGKPVRGWLRRVFGR